MENKKLNVWSKQIKDIINTKIDLIQKKDYKFYKIDRLERVAEVIDNLSDNCQVCESFKTEIKTIAETLPELLNGTVNKRAEYEKRNEIIINHLKQNHRFSYKDYFTSFFSFIGFTVGAAIFGSLMWFINKEYLFFGLFVGFAIGLIFGRIVGRKKDKLQEKRQLIF
jgi:hypothetical protein